MVRKMRIVDYKLLKINLLQLDSGITQKRNL